MLTEIRLDFFKCFEVLRLPLGRLTLLTGINASGKSTVVQAPTLLHQSAVDTNWGPQLLLDGSVLKLGTLGDVVDKVNGRRKFSIGLSGSEFVCTWTFESTLAERRDIAVPLSELQWRDARGAQRLSGAGGAVTHLLPPELRAAEAGRALERLLESLTYISAERMGPRETYPLADPARHRTVGPQGDMAPGKLYWFQEEPVEEKLRHVGEPVPTLYKQTQAWLADFFPGAALDAQSIRSANLVTLGFRTSRDTDFHRPQHVGFGLSHILPILVACLHARPGDLIIIENPEVHLHPLGQAKMGLFLGQVASAGVQVLIETHSDHILNGIRRAVKRSVLQPSDVALHFFQSRALAEARREAQVSSPRIDREGGIDHWPEGFFDQFEKDMNYFAGLVD